MNTELVIYLAICLCSMMLGYVLRMAHKATEWQNGWHEGFRAGLANNYEQAVDDPTPWCSICGSMTRSNCDCPPQQAD